MKWATLLFVCCFIFLSPLMALAAVNKLVFTTESQTILPSALSEPLTIQAQDNGSSSNTTETFDLVFTSTSATGEFLNSAGNEASKTMNRNTANRSFYYRDSSTGTFTIQVTATGRDTGKVLSASQAITISNSASPISANNSTGSNNSNSTGSILSATSEPVEVNKSSIASSFESYAGENRLTAAGSPITFEARIKKGNDDTYKPIYSWSFGDGTVGGGERPFHIYKHPGTYAVVLTVQQGASIAISRLTVTAIEPKITFTVQPDFVEIENESSEEINIFNWKLTDGIKSFIFQPGTIILPGNSVRFDAELLALSGLSLRENTGNAIVLLDALGRDILASKALQSVQAMNTTEFENNLQAVQEQLTSIQDGLLSLEIPDSSESSNASSSGEIAIETPLEEDFSQVAAAVLSDTSVATNSLVIFESPEKEAKGFWRNILDFLFSSK